MKATGEVMGIGSNLEECMLKSVSSLEIGVTHLHMQKFDTMSTEEIMEYISSFRADGIFAVTELIRRGGDIQTIYELKDLAEITWWHIGAVDIVPKGISKANGIDEVCKRYSILQSETMGIGDGENDIGMLQHCAIGIAMGNAIDELKAQADYVTTSVDDDGILHALKHFHVIQP